VDALLVINYLNQFGSGEGEATSADDSAAATAAFDSAFALYGASGFGDLQSSESYQTRKRLAMRSTSPACTRKHP
jgi:hypothetical protein